MSISSSISTTLTKLSSDCSSSGKSWLNKAFTFFRKPDDCPFMSSNGVRIRLSSGFSAFILARTFSSPSRISSNAFACSSSLSPNFSSKDLISPAWDNLSRIFFIPAFFSTSRASDISSISATMEPAPISSTPHCHFSRVSLPVSSKTNTFVT